MKIYIKTTESCNLKCRHCYIGDCREKTAFFDVDKTIGYLKKYITKYRIPEKDLLISFHGGEPFLDELDKLQKVCEAFPGASYDATTNLMNLNDEIMCFIKRFFLFNGVPFVKTSWDYKIRFFSQELENRWIANVRRLITEDVEVKVNICLTKLLIDEIKPEKLIEFLSSLNIKMIHFERLTENTTADKSLIADYDDIDDWLVEFYSVNRGRIHVDNFFEIEQAVKGVHIDCRKRQCMSNTLTINADGTVGGCPNTSLSDCYTCIDDEPCFNTAAHSCLIRREELRRSECYFCELYDICNGDCHQLSWYNSKCPGLKKLIRRIKDDLA